MRKSITWTPQAEEDAYETYRHIALDSIDAAENELCAAEELI